MSYRIEKNKNKTDFIVQYNHSQDLLIKEGAELVDGIYTEFTYALEPNEMMFSEEVDMEVIDTDNIISTDPEGNKTYGKKLATLTLSYPIINPNYEEELYRIEQERIGKLSLTKREVFLAIYKDKGISPEQIRSQITDVEALIEFDYAEKYYRGNPLIDELGKKLGYTAEELDYLFKHKTFNPTKPEVLEDLENLEMEER